jgi:MscS family membrane protein
MEALLEQLSYWTGQSGWIMQVFMVVLFALTLDFFQRRVLDHLQKALTATRTPWDDAFLLAIRKPLSLLIWVVGLTFAAHIIRVETETTLFDLAEPLRRVGVVVSLAWFLIGIIYNAEVRYVEQAEEEGKEVDHTMVEAVARLLRLSVWITAALVTLQTLGWSVSGVLAFGGIGGIAVGFAAKDLLSNFFGGMMIYLDRPFSTGDWIRSPDKNIEGTVEKIGWRLTRIRTFDKRPLYVPNSVFTTIAVENPSRMSHRRIYETMGLRYDDANKVEKIISDVKAMLRDHPEIASDQTMIVNANAFAPSSIDFFIYTFTRTTNWVRYHEIKQDVLLKILDIVSANGAEMAFPTTTVHVPEGLGLATETRAGEIL